MVQFAEKQAGELFEKIKVANLPFSSMDLPTQPTDEYTLAAITSKTGNQGRSVYVKETPYITKLNNCITIASNGNAGTAFYQTKPFTILQDSYAIKLKDKYEPDQKDHDEVYLYFTTLFNKVKPKYGWNKKAIWERESHEVFQVPVTASGALDTEYMASYVRKIEASYVRKIEAYLSVLGYKSMDDVKLTDHEQKLLDGGVRAQPTSKFRISAFYQVCPISFKYDGSQLRKAGSTPVYSSIETKYGVLGYTDDNPQFDITVNDYLIFGDHTRTMRFPNKSFSVADNTKVLRTNFKMTQKQKLFLITAWHRAIPNLGYARHWSIAKKAEFRLPVVTTGLASGDPDWQFMENYITAIEKLKVLKLKQFLDHKLDLYQKVIH